MVKLLSKIFKRKNQKKLKIYRTCKTLPAIRFFDGLLRTGDLRYLIDCEELPEIDTKFLEPIYDEILNEYDILTNRFIIKHSLENSKDTAKMLNKITGIKACYNLMISGNDKCFEYFKYWDIKIDKISFENINKVRQIITRLQTDLIIQSDKFKKNDNTASWMKSLVSAMDILKLNLDEEKISVYKWIFIENRVTDIIKSNVKQRNKL